MRAAFYSGILASGLSLGFVLPASADISAQEVRDQLFGYYETLGYDVSVDSEVFSDGALTISGLEITVDIPDEDGQVVIGINEFTFRDTGDGSVSIELPEAMDYRIGFVEDDREVASAVFDIKIVNYSGLVSGDVDNMRIQSSFDSTSMAVDSVKVGRGEFPVTFKLNLGATRSDYTFKTLADDQREILSDLEIASLDIVAAADDPEGGDGFFSLTANMQDIGSTGDMTIPSMAAFAALAENPEAVFGAGLFVDAVIEFGASEFDVAFQDRGTSIAVTAKSSGGLADVLLSKEAIAYEIVQQGVDVSFASSDIPFPSVEFAYDEFAFGIEIPLAKSDEPSDFHARAALRGLTVGDPIWAMIDAGGSIPRDPATVAVDVSGKVTVLVDLLDAEVLDNLDDMAGPPMLPVSLDL
ncbi:MAG: hypothetical protein ACJAXU_001319, partial [Paracoccaceae bacterium]